MSERTYRWDEEESHSNERSSGPAWIWMIASILLIVVVVVGGYGFYHFQSARRMALEARMMAEVARQEAMVQRDMAEANRVLMEKDAATKAPQAKRLWADDIVRDAWVLRRPEFEKKYQDVSKPAVNVRGSIVSVTDTNDDHINLKLRLPNLTMPTGDKPRYVICRFLKDPKLFDELRKLEKASADILVIGHVFELRLRNADPQPVSLLINSLEVETEFDQWKYDPDSKSYSQAPK